MAKNAPQNSRDRAQAGFLTRILDLVTGLAQDFWKDGNEMPFRLGRKASSAPGDVPLSDTLASFEQALGESNAASWHAGIGEIDERLWGETFLLPADPRMTDMLLKPLGLTPQMNLLDLSAGLGGRLMMAARESGVTVAGLDPDPAFAAIGSERMALAGLPPISTYIPEDLGGDADGTQFDCIIARELFYRVADKAAFFAAIGKYAKPQTQISFTDYIVNPEDREKPAIVNWMSREGGSRPLSVIEMAELWAKENFRLRINDDQTDLYRTEVFLGLKRLADFLSSSKKPDAETRLALLQALDVWTHRVAALQQGLKLYRFYGTR